MKPFIYYLPFHSIRLSQYMGSACICPARYDSNQIIDDQSIYPNHLLLSENCGSDSSNCCLELSLSESEQASLFLLETTSHLYLFNKPLPISRVRKVYFKNEHQRQQTIASITLSTAFIPEHLTNTRTFNTFKIPHEKDNIITLDWTDKIRQFDKLLGGFALMKLNENKYRNFSDHYFSTLSYFNPKIADILKLQNIEIDNRYFDIFEGKDLFRNLTPYLKQKIDENILKEIALADGNQQIQYKGNSILRINVDTLNNMAYIAAILYEYGVGNEVRHDKIDSLILSRFKMGLKPNMAEIIALTYGMNRGYTIFPNKYKLLNKTVEVKFSLDSQLDYYTIESLYQNSINRNNISYDFYYIDWFFDQININKDEYYFKVFDTYILANQTIKATSLNTSIPSLLQSLPIEWRSVIEPLFNKFSSIIHENIQINNNHEIENRDIEIQQLKKEISRLNQQYKEVYSAQKNLENSSISRITNIQKEEIANYILDLNEMKSEDLNKLAKKYNYKEKGNKKREKILYIFKSQLSNLKIKL